MLSLIVSVLAAFVPVYAHDTSFLQPHRISSSINSFGSNRLGLYDDRNMIMARDCYDLCYDAQLSRSRTRVAGCVCSRYDYLNIDLGVGGRNQRRYSTSTSCNCPSGYVCVRSSSTRRRQCVRRSSRNGYPLNTGLPRRLGGRCGYLSPVCQASQRDLNQQVRFTYDYSLRRCVRERVHSVCTPQGPRNNIFASSVICNRMCL